MCFCLWPPPTSQIVTRVLLPAVMVSTLTPTVGTSGTSMSKPHASLYRIVVLPLLSSPHLRIHKQGSGGQEARLSTTTQTRPPAGQEPRAVRWGGAEGGRDHDRRRQSARLT
eukprot:COSAG01_NODE_2641_length_7322_cov_115.896456_2_plen_112_part_00